MVNSRLGLFTATCSRRHPFFRSYGVNMPSSLTTLLPSALGSSPHPPVSVCGTGASDIPHTFSRRRFRLLPYWYFSPFRPGRPSPGSGFRFVSVCLNLRRLRNFNRMCIGYAFRPHLSSGLPRADEPAPRNLRFSAIAILTQFSLLIPAFSLVCCPRLLPLSLRLLHNAPLPRILYVRSLSFGCMLSPVKSSAQLHSTSELLRTL